MTSKKLSFPICFQRHYNVLVQRFLNVLKTSFARWDDSEDVHVISTFMEDVAKRLSLERPYILKNIIQTNYGSEIKNETTVCTNIFNIDMY